MKLRGEKKVWRGDEKVRRRKSKKIQVKIKGKKILRRKEAEGKKKKKKRHGGIGGGLNKKER